MYRPTVEKCPGVHSVATRILFGRVVMTTDGGAAADASFLRGVGVGRAERQRATALRLILGNLLVAERSRVGESPSRKPAMNHMTLSRAVCDATRGTVASKSRLLYFSLPYYLLITPNPHDEA